MSAIAVGGGVAEAGDLFLVTRHRQFSGEGGARGIGVAGVAYRGGAAGVGWCVIPAPSRSRLGMSAIAIGRGVAEGDDLFLSPAIESFQARVVRAALGWQASLIGAAVPVLDGALIPLPRGRGSEGSRGSE